MFVHVHVHVGSSVRGCHGEEGVTVTMMTQCNALLYSQREDNLSTIHTIPGFYLEILYWEGNMVDKDSKKGHNTLLYVCTVGAFAALAFNTHTSVIKNRAIPV